VKIVLTDSIIVWNADSDHPLTLCHETKESLMDREHVKGAADKAKGTIKQGAGKISGDKELEHEGKADKAKGDLHEAAGNIKDAARKAADSLKK
jgi:uncharacterized protein YjbJ (UPF0337 family)